MWMSSQVLEIPFDYNIYMKCMRADPWMLADGEMIT